MTTPLKVDKQACIGSGLCAAMHPGLFRLSGDGRGEAVLAELTDPDDIEFAQDVADCCPGQAVLLDADE
ncbi:MULTISPECIES: ferredoxin [unclassified Streptomyces]|uniref:ferredoxin n=1 Tax=unclassified Streptomyces TaxID=2593676 RepID=UPI0033212442